MPLRLTARHRARLSAMRRIAEIRAEREQLLAYVPELRPSAKRPGVLPEHDTTEPALRPGGATGNRPPAVPGNAPRRRFVF